MIPYKVYSQQSLVYDDIYKNIRSSYFQKPQYYVVSLSINLLNVKLKYILYSLLFLNIITLQKPYLSFGKQVKINLNLQKGSFIGCKICLRKESMYSFLNNLILNIFPKVKIQTLFKKPLKSKQLKKELTFHLKDLAQYYNEIELFYPYFQTIQMLTITIHLTAPLSLNQYFSMLYLPLINKKN